MPLLQAQPSAQRWRRIELSRDEALKLWADKRLKGWWPTTAQWQPPAAAAQV